MKSETSSKPSNNIQKKQKTLISSSNTKKTSITSKQGQQQIQSIPSSTIPAINTISKQNYDIMYKKFNITQIEQLQLKYVLRCIDGLYKNRFLYITTHKEGEIFGSGNAKEEGLTLQIQGVGLDKKHCKLKFNGYKKFYVKDYGSQTGTWLKIPKNGIQIKNNDTYLVQPWLINFKLSTQIPQIQQICQLYDHNELCDMLLYNKITTLQQLYKASYNKYKEYPFTKQQIQVLNNICNESKNWYNQDKNNKIIILEFMNEEVKGFSLEVGWQAQRIYENMHYTIENYQPEKNDKNGIKYIAQINKGMLIPNQNIFNKISADKNYQINLHDQVKIGNLIFQLNRFNIGQGQSIGGRELMEDCIIVEQDIGGSQWKLISLFAVIDGYGGSECVDFIKANLIKKVRQWTPMLDEAGDLNQMLRLLMCKTFYEIDYEFYKSHTDIADSCGATMLCILIIDSKLYSFNLGDNRGLIYRNQLLYKISIDQIPSRIDQKSRIEQAGGFVQYNRLNGKCTLSRAFGQFEYKQINDYKNNMKGKLKSCLSCIPEVICFDILPESDEFILLSTDGIFDALNMKTIVDYILQRAAHLEKEQNPNKIVNTLMQNCKITNPNCDNMAVILIFIKKGKIGNKNSF